MISLKKINLRNKNRDLKKKLRYVTLHYRPSNLIPTTYFDTLFVLDKIIVFEII